TATAWLSSTTEEPVSSTSRRYSSATFGQSIRSRVCTDAIAACPTEAAPRPCRRELAQVPQRPVLIAEQHEILTGEPGPPPGVVDHHQREQPVCLRFVRHERGEHSPQVDGFGAEIDPAAVALVVDQVDDGEHRIEAVGQ